MSRSGESEPLLTLEPLLEAVRDGVEDAHWELSGLQKTTSTEFEGRWSGETTRSAYLFFHRDDLPESVSVEAFLDETPKGLRGNLSLVVQGPELAALGDLAQVLGRIARAVVETLPEGYRTPLSARVGLPDAHTAPESGEVQLRVKLNLPRSAIESGASAVAVLATGGVNAFERLLERPEVAELLPPVMD